MQWNRPVCRNVSKEVGGSFQRTAETTPVGFEPTRGDPIALAGRRLNRSAKVSVVCRGTGRTAFRTDLG